MLRKVHSLKLLVIVLLFLAFVLLVAFNAK
jgi:hypothetical protein